MTFYHDNLQGDIITIKLSCINCVNATARVNIRNCYPGKYNPAYKKEMSLYRPSCSILNVFLGKIYML